MEGDFCLTPPASDDLTDTLFRYAEGFGDAGSGFTRFIARDNPGVSVGLLDPIRLWFVGGWRIVEHLHDVKSSQPNIEASCGFEPPMGH